MIRALTLAALTLAIASASASAQTTSYCSGALVADTFDTQVVPGLGGRATYSMRLRNSSGQARTFQLVVTAPFLGRPVPQARQVAAGATQNIGLGYQPNMPGSPPLRGQQLAEVVRISCV
ncbi:hypothetical protein [Roseococcus sp. YIM B11640]|uniref:hypothetical protein n=1 Tax=Roseococcus sp. YIM B11640 TaxID=3133973 RepID=UPI003C7E010B